ncbi:MAG TPA: hypothetical protein VMT38_07275 [Terracidiphilus sp.]|nr:hypothetical protein [Terracidiphilus sp.]
MSICRSLAVFTFVALAYPVFAQLSSAPGQPIHSQHPRPAYSATFDVTTQQTLADGTVITRESTETEAQDSEGRHLHSVTQATPLFDHDLGTFASANDPVGLTQSSWNSRTKTAKVIKLPPRDQRQGCWADEAGNFRINDSGARNSAPTSNLSITVGGAALPNMPLPLPGVPANLPAYTRPKPTIEDLGTQTIDGLEAHGHRFTTTIQAGQVGNDEPIVTTHEDWSSTQFGLIVRSVTDDPRSGKRTRELVDFTPGEPDPITFQPPEGYEITTEELHKVDCPPTQ